MITPGLLGALSPFDGPIDPPAGLPAAPTRLAVVITWFGLAGPPAIAGWTLAGWTTDARGIDPTFTALLFLDVPDGSAVAAVTPTGISGWLGQMVSIDGDIDAAYDVALQANQVLDTVAPGPLAATEDGSFLLVACGCWNFAAWQASGFGGAQLYPPGFVPTLGPANPTELGGFYLDAIPVGAIDTTFGLDVERFAVVAVLFKPAGPPPPPPVTMNKLTTSAPVGANISLASTNQQPLGVLIEADVDQGPEALYMYSPGGIAFAAPAPNYVLGTGTDFTQFGSGLGRWLLTDSNQPLLTYQGEAGRRYMVRIDMALDPTAAGPEYVACGVSLNGDILATSVGSALAFVLGSVPILVGNNEPSFVCCTRIIAPTPGQTVGVALGSAASAANRTAISFQMILTEVNRLP